MSVDVRSLPFGAPALLALANSITGAQVDDRLAPVTVITSTGRVAVATRRLLASRNKKVSVPGLVNVRFVTLNRVAEQIATWSPTLHSKLPLTEAILHAAARSVLSREPGALFAPVARHPATAKAIAATYNELKTVGPAALAKLARQSERVSEVVRLIGAIRTELADWSDEHDILDDAIRIAQAREFPAAEALGHIAVYLPLELVPRAEHLLSALGDVTSVEVLVGLTGDPDADSLAGDLIERLSAATQESTVPCITNGTGAVNASSADSEVLFALRQLMQRNATGTPLERMALVHGGSDPYPWLIEDTLTAAGIPFNGASARARRSTIAGRTLLDLFTLVERDWRRSDVIAWLSSTPVRHRREVVPATTWDSVSADAGIVNGLDSWKEKLEEYAAGLEYESERLTAHSTEDLPAWRVERQRERANQARELGSFISNLAGRFESLPETWSKWCEWADDVLETYLGSSARRHAWPPDEQLAFEATKAAVRSLNTLDGVDPSPSLAGFRGALSTELESRAPRSTRFGQGVFVGHFRQIVGMDLDVVFVLGMNDGAFPARAAEDPLVPDWQRQECGGVLPLRSSRAIESRRDYLAALSSGQEQILSFARGDQQNGRELRPSRWFLDTLRHLTASTRRLYSRDLEQVSAGDRYVVLPSYEATVASDQMPHSVSDWDQRSALRWCQEGKPLSEHFLVRMDRILELGLQARRARRSSALTRFDGLVRPMPIAAPVTGGAPQSATRLESYAECPRRYFLTYQLRVAPKDRPEELLDMKATDRGTLIHEVLEEFLRPQTALPLEDRIGPRMAWSDSDRAQLQEIFRQEAHKYESRRLTGPPLRWRLTRDAIARDLDTFLVADNERRSLLNAVPERVEYEFGPGHTTVAINLSDGRRVWFRGLVDRIDLTVDGDAVVTDYKSGSDWGYRDLERDAVAKGQKLQLVIYALAVRARHGEIPVRSDYWFVSERGGFKRVGYDVGAEELKTFHDALEVIVNGIEGGAFPARPGKRRFDSYENCAFCDYEPVCPIGPARGQEWERKRTDPALAAYLQLVEPTQGVD